MSTIGTRLRNARSLKKFTIAELSKQSAVSPGAISLAERDLSVLASDSLGRICLVLGISADHAIYGETVKGGINGANCR
jgi:transcriptional regulator with XRE-family HTH domain